MTNTVTVPESDSASDSGAVTVTDTDSDTDSVHRIRENDAWLSEAQNSPAILSGANYPATLTTYPRQNGF